jgi:signal recognition particle subunit SRP54
MDQAPPSGTAKKLAKGQFDLDDLRSQLQQLRKMGGMGGIMGLLPGVQKIKKQLADAEVAGGDKALKRQEAIIGAMTAAERKKPEILNASRKRRIAKGAGVEVAELNRLLKQHRQMADMFKAMGKGGGRGFAQMAQAMGMGGPGAAGAMGGGGMGAPAVGGPDLARLKALGGGKLPAPDQTPPAPGGLPGLGSLPGLGGGFPFKKT